MQRHSSHQHVLIHLNPCPHYPPPSPHSDDYFLKLSTRQSIKRRATDYPDQRPSKMVLIEVEDKKESFDYRDLTNLRRSISRAKLQKRKGKIIPRNRVEAVSALEDLVNSCEPTAKLIKCINNDIVMLATDSTLQLIRENYQCFGDGTFRYCPKYFGQLYTLHVFKDGFYIPVVYFLLPNQTQKTYTNMFAMLRDKVGSNHITVMNLDFEKSAMNAFKSIFPSSVLRGCRFHLAQAWQRKFREMGFQKDYNSGKGPIANFLKSIFGIPCMPHEEVPEFFREHLSKSAPSQLKKFVFYLEKYYMLPNSIFPPQLWASVGHLDMKFTTNGCENFHRHLKDWFSSPKPNIYTFLDTLQLISISSEINAKSTKPVRPDNSSYIQKLWNEAQRDNITKTVFISLCAQSVQPISKTKKSKLRRSQRILKLIRQSRTKKMNVNN